MKQKVTVIENKGEEIVVGCDKSACEGCHGSMFCSKNEHLFEVLNPAKIDLKQGDKAEIEMPSGKTLSSVFLSLAFPLIMFFPGYFIGRKFSSNELVLLLFGVIFMALGFLIAALFFKKKKKNYMPYVVGKDE